MMYPETNFNYDNNNENKGNRKQRRQNKSRRNLHKAAAVLAGVAVIGGSFWGGSLLTQNTENTVQAASTMNLSKDETTPDIVASSLTDYSDLAAKKKQEDFVQTLHDGYPFGTLLVYPENDNDKDAKLQLLDGQQRLSTIKKYRQDPLQFWKPLNRESYTSVYQSVKKMLPEGDKFTEPIFDKLVNSNPNKVAYWAMDSLSSKEDVKAAMQSIDDLKQQIRSFVNLEHLKVPMIVYLGGSAHIADVFANLNKGGVPLTKYEVFGAAWVNAAIRLRGAEESPLQDQLLQYVKNYYLDMRKQAEFDVDDFSEDELTQNRTVTLPEFGTALGQYVVDHLSALVPETTSAAPEIGFGLLGVAMNLDNRKLSSLNKYIQKIRDELEDILQKTERICNNLQSMFETLLRRFKSTGNDYVRPKYPPRYVSFHPDK